MSRLQFGGIVVVIVSIIVMCLGFLLDVSFSVFVLGGISICLVIGGLLAGGVDISVYTLTRTAHPRWVYAVLILFLIVMGLLKGFTHGWLFLALSCAWFVLYFPPRYRLVPALRYIVFVGLLDIYGYVEMTYVLIPYIYKYVTIALLARIADRYILEEIDG